MDILKIFGDYVHLLGMSILLIKLCLTRNCAGISGKTQLLNAMVFTTRYMDVTITLNSLYNTIMKIIFIIITYCTVLSIFFFFRKTYDRKHDTFRIKLLIIPSAVLGMFMTKYLVAIEVFWTFSIFLESVVIVPQVYMVSKCKQVESIVVSYIACLGLYKGFYLMHRFYQYFKRGTFDNIAIASNIVQLIFYCDFFARNLPILKPKNCANGPLPDATRDKDKTRNVVDVTGDKSLNAVVDQSSLIVTDECTSMHSVVILTPNPSDSAEKIILLNSKEQSISN